jgi:cyclic pyranopterin phosphate synthase
MRDGVTDDELHRLIRGVWADRTDRYSELRSEASVGRPRPEMSYLGG